jgi:hypothetical protein
MPLEGIVSKRKHSAWLAGLVKLAAPPIFSPETERTDMLAAAPKAA